jgi:fibronectin-binding autotransporter adhesin
LKFALSSAGTNDQINVTGGLTLNGANFITLTCPGGALIPQGTYTLMTYASTNGSGTLAFNGTISNATLNVGSTSVTLSVGPGGTSGTLVSGLTWKGNLSGIWDTGTANWTNMAGSASTYADGNAVTFDQNASKFNVTGTVATVSPGSVTFNNATAYTNGANIGGTGYLLKNGSSTATLTGTNTYTGPTLISAGTLTIGGAGQLGNGTYAGAITHNGAGLIFASSAPNTLSGGITGTGTVTKSGSGDLTIAGTNSIGALTLSAGTTSIRDATLTMSGTFTPGGTVNISNATVNLNNQGNLTVAGVANASQNTLNVFSGGIINNTTNLAIGSTANASNAVLSIRGGGLVELNTPAAISVGPGPNNSLTNFGGILQFTTATAPTITVSANNSFVMTNCTLGYRGVTVNITNNWVNSGMGTNTIAWQGNNTLRLNNSTGTNTLGRPYVFDTFHGSTNYANLEMLGTSAIRGGGVTIGTNGSMLVSNGTVNITGTLTNDNGTVTLAGSPAVLMATNTFYNNGLLTGSGTVSGLVTVGSAGTISAGGTGTVGTLTFSTNVVFSSGSTNLWTYNAGGGDTIRILGNISGTCYIKIDGSGDLPANAEVFAFSGTNGTPTFTMLTEGYSRRVTSTNVTVSFSSRGCLMIIK